MEEVDNEARIVMLICSTVSVNSGCTGRNPNPNAPFLVLCQVLGKSFVPHGNTQGSGLGRKSHNSGPARSMGTSGEVGTRGESLQMAEKDLIKPASS